MKVMKKVQKETEELDDIICDRCGKSCFDNNNFQYATLSADWGYGSKKDLEHHEAEICELCYDEVIILVGIKPKIVYNTWLG